MALRIIGGLFRGRVLSTPSGQKTRPTSQRLRETVFNICQQEIQDACFLDVFAGSGAMGFEALSRGAQHVTLIENAKQAVQCIQKNAVTLRLDEGRIRILSGDVFAMLRRLAKEFQPFDIVYIDPPYGQEEYAQTVLEFLGDSSLIKQGGIVFLEESSAFSCPKKQYGNLIFRKQRKVGGSLLLEWLI